MKKRLLCGLLLLAMLLSLLPVAAYAEDGVTKVSTAEQLKNAVSRSGSGDIKLMNDITIDDRLEIDRTLMLDLNNCKLKATEILIGNNATSFVRFAATGGTIDVPVYNTSVGIIEGGTFSGTVVNNNVISGGTFRGKVGNCNLISYKPTSGMPQARITGGDFYGEVTNGPVNEGNVSGTISRGNFYGKVTNTGFGMITGGSFYGEVESNAERLLLNGIPYGCITGGTFYNGLTDNSTGDDPVQTWTVTYYDIISAKPCARQVVQDNGMASAPAFTDGRTVSGWYTDEACMEAYDFDTFVTKNITLYAKLALSYNLIITDASGEAHTVTSENANDVLGDGSHAVVYTPGSIDSKKDFTADDWNKALRGETVEGIRLPKLTLNGANLQSIRMEGVYGDDENMKLLSRMLQIELVGDNTITCDGDRARAIRTSSLLITGTGSLNATATGENAIAIAVDSEGGRYYQYGGDVTLDGEYSGIYCTEAYFEFAAGKLTVRSSKSALYCELDDSHFKITSDTTTFFCGISEKDTFEIQKPFDPENIHRQLKEKQCYFVPIPENETIHYAQLTSNHKVSFDTDGGKEVDEQIVAWGETVEKPENPTRRGYTFDGWYLDGNEFDFDTPVTKDMTLTAKWTKNGASGGSTVRTESPNRKADTTLIFDDVRRTDWFYDDIAYVYKHGLMSGTSTYRFSPDAPTTRAMIVTILWRLENEPVVNFAMRFADVSPDQWYGEAVRWAAANGIVNGYSETAFGPDDLITREQLAAMLYRYAQYQKADVSVGEDTNILSYDDAFDVSGYAMAAMQWACGAGVMQGAGGKLLPAAEATRAQTAAMLHRFCEDVLK